MTRRACPMRCLLLLLPVLLGSAHVHCQEEDARDLLAILLGLPEEAAEKRIELGLRALAGLERGPDQDVEAQLHYELGVTYQVREEYAEARIHYAECARVSMALGDDESRLVCLANLVTADNILGDFDAALRASDEAFLLARGLGRDDILWKLENGRGTVHERRGDFALALEAYSRALEIVETLGDRAGEATVLNNIGVSYNNLGQASEALEFLEQAILLFEEFGTPGWQATAMANLADSLALQGEHEGALLLHFEALNMRNACCPGISQAISHNSISKVYLQMDELVPAIEHAEAALEIEREMELVVESIDSLAILAKAYAKANRSEEALAAAQEGLDVARAIETQGMRVSALQALAQAQRAAGNLEAAFDALQEAAAVEREIRSLESQREFAAFRARFQDKEKERRIALLEKDNRIQALELNRQRLLRDASLAGAGLLLILGLLSWGCFSWKRRAERALGESQLNYHTLCKLSPVGIFRTDAAGAIVYVNQRWSAMTGIIALDAADGWIDAIGLEDRERVRAEWGRCISSVVPFQADYRVARKDGKYTCVLGQAVPEMDARRRVTGYVGTITDMTSQRELEERAREAQKLSGLGMLAGGVAHDFNNLLTTIIGNASLAADDVPLGSPGSQSLEAINGAAERAAELCSQLLAYAGKGRFQTARVDVNEAVREMSELLRVTVANKTLRLDLATHLPPILGDSTQIRQIVLNLMTNAAEAIGQQAGTLTLKTRLSPQPPADPIHSFCAAKSPPNGFVVLQVADDGCGFDEDVRSKIFDPFFTTKVAGHGLGMAAVLGIVRAHRGAIRIETGNGEGTTVEVYLPSSDEATEPVRDPPAPLPVPNESGTVLVVDDDAGVRLASARTLERAGYAVLTAKDGAHALEVYGDSAAKIGLVLLDVIMPNIDGIEVLQRLRAQRRGLPIILTSGFTEEDATRRMEPEERGPLAFLKKPYRRMELLDAVRSMIADPLETTHPHSG